jgi:hypothetical protein
MEVTPVRAARGYSVPDGSTLHRLLILQLEVYLF